MLGISGVQVGSVLGTPGLQHSADSSGELPLKLHGPVECVIPVLPASLAGGKKAGAARWQSLYSAVPLPLANSVSAAS